MTPYLAIYLFYVAIYCFELYFQRPFSFSLKMILLLPLVIFGGLRFEIGADWQRYFETFYLMGALNFFASMLVRDIAYGALNWISYHLVFPSFFVFNTIVSAITVFSFALFSKNLGSKNFWFLICAFIPYHFVIVSFGFVRQSLALSMLFTSMYLYEVSKIKSGNLFLFLGLLFHKSLAAMFPVFVYIRGFNFRMLFFLVIPAMFFMAYYFDFIMRRILSYSDGSFNSVGVLFRTVLTFMAAFSLLFFPRIISGLSAYRNFTWVFFFYSLLLGFLSFKFSTIVDRLMVYSILFIYPFIVGLNSIFAPRFRIVVRLSILSAIFLFLFGWLGFANNAGSWVPYKVDFAG